MKEAMMYFLENGVYELGYNVSEQEYYGGQKIYW